MCILINLFFTYYLEQEKWWKLSNQWECLLPQEFKCLAEYYAIARSRIVNISALPRFPPLIVRPDTLRAYNKGVSRKRAQLAVSGRRRSLNSLRHSLTIDVVCRAHVYRRRMCTSLHILWLLVSPSGQLLFLFRYWSKSFWKKLAF